MRSNRLIDTDVQSASFAGPLAAGHRRRQRTCARRHVNQRRFIMRVFRVFAVTTFLLLISPLGFAKLATTHNLDLARWTDPLTPPQGPWVSCAKWAKPWPGAKICVGHNYRWKYMDCRLFAHITTPKPELLLDRAKAAVEQAAVKTALVELLKGAASGGASASTAGATFVALLTDELKKVVDSPSIKLDQACGWSSAR